MSFLFKKEPQWLTGLGMLFVSFLLISTVVAMKPIAVGALVTPAAILVFPLTYMIMVVVTEVYGVSHARKIIWLAMFCNLAMAACYQSSLAMKPMEGWIHQDSYEQILGASTQTVLASIVAFLFGQFFNTYIVAKMKIIQQGQRFWLRAMIAMGASEALGTAVFVLIAFYGVMPLDLLFEMGAWYYLLKMLYAQGSVPLLAIFARWLKKREGLNVVEPL